MPIQIKVQPDRKYRPVPKVGSFGADWDIVNSPQLLEKLVNQKKAQFVHDMELRGYELYRGTPIKCLRNKDGKPLARYALDWAGTPETAPDGGEMPKKWPKSLDDSKGKVEFRLIGMFWSPERTMERLVSRDEILKAEKEARNPVQFGYKRQPGTGLLLR